MAQVKHYSMTLLDKGVIFNEQIVKQSRYNSHKSFSDFEQQEIRKQSKRKSK